MKLEAQTRTVFGKQVAALRKEGHVPAEVYGHGKDNMHVSVPHKELAKALQESGKTGVIMLGIDGKDTRVMAHEWTRDTHTGAINHVDFYAVKAGEKIRAGIPLEFDGEAPAIKEGLGTLLKNLHELEVEALPEKLPHDFVIDISSLTELGSAVHASDVKMPAGVELVTAPETVIVSIAELQEEEVAEDISVDQVVVEGDEKKKDEEASS